VAADLELQIWAVVGASGTGKGLWIKQRLRELQPVRLVAWDFKDEYQEFGDLVPTISDMRARMIQAGTGPGRFRYICRGAGEKNLRKEFEAVCELVYAWEHCIFVAEELANVTTPGWAPASWRKMTTSGRHAGVHIIGATQTPALVDKTFLGNATMVHCCALREFAHRQAVARSMDVPEPEIAALRKFEWLEKDFDSGEVSRGVVKVPGRRGR
jgi:hypothetical protein